MRVTLAFVALLASSGISQAAPSVADRFHGGDWQRLEDTRDPVSGWRGTRDRDTGVLTAMWGNRMLVAGASANPAIGEAAARAFLAEHLAQLAPGTRIDDWTLVANQLDLEGKRTVAFAQHWHDLEVVGGQLQLVIARDAIFAALSQAQGHVAASLEIRAHELSRSLPRGATRVVLPIEGRFEIADHTIVSDGRELWDVYVALDGRPLASIRQSRDATATLALDVPQQRPGPMRRTVLAGELQITVDGAPVTTRPDGAFDFSGAGVVQTSVVGTRVVVTNALGAAATTSLTATDGGTVTWSAPTDAAVEAQLSAFAHVTIGKAAARVIVPGIEAWLDEPLNVSVNEPGGECNARSAGDGLHFFAGSAKCENTARIADVVYHELGHSVHSHAVIMGAGSTANAALGEGLADYFAASVTGSSAIGRGFEYDDRPVREIDPVADERRAPDDLVPEPHISGLVISGALWDLRRMLVYAHGEPVAHAAVNRIYAGLLARAANIPSTYMAALIADDDDGDLANRTPNQCEIDRAFSRHGLAPAGVQVTTVLTPILDGLSLRVPVERAATTCVEPALTVSGLQPEADGSAWVGTLTPAPFEATPYRVLAGFADGEEVAYPQNRADPAYTLPPTQTKEIWCEHFDTDPMWPQYQTGSPAPWQFGVPRGQAGDPTSGFTGDNVLGVDLTDDGRYAAVGETTVTAPDVDVSAYENIHVQFRRWLTVEDALYDRARFLVNDQPVWMNAVSEDGSVDHVDREWRFVDYKLSTLVTGPTVSLSWTLSSDDSRQLGGWNLDDVCIVGEVADPPFCPPGENCNEGCDDGSCDGGCCSSSNHPASATLLGAAVLGLLRRRKRRSARRDVVHEAHQ